MRLALALVIVVLAGCAGGNLTLPAPVTPAPAVLPTAKPPATPTPTRAPVNVNAGRILFGKDWNRSNITIKNPQPAFDKDIRRIAWAADLIEPAGAAKLTWTVSRKRGQAETIVWSERIDAIPEHSVFGNRIDLAGLVGNKAGTYVMRYIRGDTVLAEGTFKLR